MRRGQKHSEAAKRLNAIAHLGRHHTEEAKRKVGLASLGRNVGPKSEEHRAKIAATLTGRKHSAETKAKMRVSQGLRGPTRPPEHCARISASLSGKKKSKAACKAMSLGAAIRVKRDGPLPYYGRGTPTTYAGTRFRSTWEARFAKALDEKGIAWQYEPRYFDLGDTTYTPDFYLPKLRCYWEVKGYFGDESQRKVALFRERYPEIPLIVATQPILKLMRF